MITSVTKKAWNPYGTLWGKSIIATGSDDIVFALITCTDDFLHSKNPRSDYEYTSYDEDSTYHQCMTSTKLR